MNVAGCNCEMATDNKKNDEFTLSSPSVAAAAAATAAAAEGEAEKCFKLFTSLRWDPQLVDSGQRGEGGNDDDENGDEEKKKKENQKKQAGFYMLGFHRDRMLRAARYWGWERTVEVLSGEEGLERLVGAVSPLREELNDKGGGRPKRVKLTVSKKGVIGCECVDVPRTKMANLFPAVLPPPEGEAGPREGNVPSKEKDGTAFRVFVDANGTQASEFTHFKTTRREMYNRARERARIGLKDRKETLIVKKEVGTVMEGTITTPYFWREGRWVTPPVGEIGEGGQDGTTRRWALESGLAVEEEVKADSIVHGEECWLSNGVRGFIFGRVMRA